MKKLLIFGLVTMTVLAQAQGRGGAGGRGGASMTGLLSRTDVRSELKVTDDQKAKLDELMPQRGNRQNAGAGGQGTGQAGAGQQGGRGQGQGQGQNFDPAAAAQRAAEREKAVLAILNEGQIKRLKELYVQRVGYRALSREDMQKSLGLPAEKVAKIKDLMDKQRQANTELMQKVRNQEMDRQEAQEIIQKNDKSLNDEIEKVLSSDEIAKFKAMRGAEFAFDEGN